jgi:prepilin-type N-terminal cleavage/methylation domain-containing protein
MRLHAPAMNQRGDTIIEVLIAIAIVSLVLTTAYAITNKNTQAIQANEERLQAQRLVESQIELLSTKSASLTSSYTCFDASGVPNSANACVRSGIAGSGATYTISVTQNPVNSVYTVKATWASLTGVRHTNNTDDSNVTMYYKVN